MPEGAARLTQDELAALLEPGERVVWHGGPRGFHTPLSARFTRWFAVFVMLAIGSVFIIMGRASALRTGEFDPFYPLGILLLCAVAGLIVLPVVRHHIRLRNTDYLLTDRRAIVIAEETDSFPIAPDMMLEHKPARPWRSGSVFFDTRISPFKINDRYVRLKRGFSQIADAGLVVDEIRTLQNRMALTGATPATYELPPPPPAQTVGLMPENGDAGDLPPARLQMLLKPDETMLWQGRPQGVHEPYGLRDTNRVMIIVSLAIGLWWMILGPSIYAYNVYYSALFSIGGILITCGSLIVLALGIRRRRRKLRRSLYVLTDRRAIVIDEQTRFFSITPDMPFAYHAPWRGQAASIFFAAEPASYRINRQEVTLKLGFVQIPDAEAVVQMIRDVQARMRRRPEVRYA